MPLHLKKLSVGSDGIDSLGVWHEHLLAETGRIMHITRSFPKRIDEILPNGSIFWIIKGKMVARQVIEDFIQVPREDKGFSCGIVLRRGLIPVIPKPHHGFQGWRYLEADQAPADLPKGEDSPPQEMAEELRELGLL